MCFVKLIPLVPEFKTLTTGTELTQLGFEWTITLVGQYFIYENLLFKMGSQQYRVLVSNYIDWIESAVEQ